MKYCDDRRTRHIETPVGDVTVVERMWNEGEKNEHWATTQDLTVDVDKSMSNGVVLGNLLAQYSLARRLIEDGYMFHSTLDDTTILWINYTSNSNDNRTNQN